MFFATLVVLGIVVAMMAYANYRYGSTVSRQKLFLLVLIAFASFALFGDECDDSAQTSHSVGGVEVWDGDSPAADAASGAINAFNDTADSVSDFTHDAAENVLNTDFSNGNSLCDGLNCK